MFNGDCREYLSWWRDIFSCAVDPQPQNTGTCYGDTFRRLALQNIGGCGEKMRTVERMKIPVVAEFYRAPLCCYAIAEECLRGYRMSGARDSARQQFIHAEQRG